MSLPCKMESDGILLAVRVTARAKRSEMVGVTNDADGRSLLSIRIAAPPAEGAANKTLCRMLADRFDVPVSAVRLRSGETSRLKLVHLGGDAELLARRLAHLVTGL